MSHPARLRLAPDLQMDDSDYLRRFLDSFIYLSARVTELTRLNHLANSERMNRFHPGPTPPSSSCVCTVLHSSHTKTEVYNGASFGDCSASHTQLAHLPAKTSLPFKMQHSSYRALLNDIMQKYHLQVEYQDTVHGPSQAHGMFPSSRRVRLR